MVWSSKIVYPWRAANAIVKAGEKFEVWFNADAEQTINYVELRGAYNTVEPTISIDTGNWEYDEWSGNQYNTKINVTVPQNAPEERYDIIVNTSSGDIRSLAAVKVIKEYKDVFYILHISDAHRWQGSYDTKGVILKEISAVVDVANIIDPAVIVETGDQHYPNTNNMDGDNYKSTKNRIIEYMNGSSEFRGMNDFYAPVFSVPGNHCTPNKAYYKEPGYSSSNLNGPWLKGPAAYWNKYYGLQYHYFRYGSTRFIGVNNAWCPDTGGGAAGYVPNYKWQLDGAINWLNRVGSGNFTVAFCHVPQESIPPVFNALNNAGYEPGLMLAGHIHRTNSNPFSINGKEIVYTTDTPRDGKGKAPFNLYKVNNLTGTYEPVGNLRAIQEGLESEKNYNSSMLKLTYANENDGSFANNTATIVNKYDFPIEGARVRFVMPKGTYSISDGIVWQTIENDDVKVIDVRISIEAGSTTNIVISDTVLCADDPNKTEPGLCGCGVPEGSCVPSQLIVENGRGDGSYYPYEALYINADNPAEGKMFDAWVVDSGNPFINNVNDPSAIIEIRGENTSVRATYKDIPKYTLIVNNGAGSGEYSAGEEILISANTTSENKRFKRWIVEEGDPKISFSFSATTSLVMPAEKVSITATYSDVSTKIAVETANKEEELAVYPIPLGDKLTIDFVGLKDLRNVDVRITNMKGGVVYSNLVHNKEQLEISTKDLLKSSVYIVSVTSGKTKLTRKIITE
ncbi:MAG: metallophosphoesterase [Prolixibacteraceae bacterium]|nr:metallophosphoesterase [Prolixibacteraceae bacterium]